VQESTWRQTPAPGSQAPRGAPRQPPPLPATAPTREPPQLYSPDGWRFHCVPPPLETIAALQSRRVVASDKNPALDDDPNAIAEPRPTSRTRNGCRKLATARSSSTTRCWISIPSDSIRRLFGSWGRSRCSPRGRTRPRTTREPVAAPAHRPWASKDPSIGQPADGTPGLFLDSQFPLGSTILPLASMS
jgi:hypothetical protein